MSSSCWAQRAADDASEGAIARIRAAYVCCRAATPRIKRP
jgi:hypothetical protein